MFLLNNKHLKLFDKIQKRGIGRCCNDLSRDEKKLLTENEWYSFAKAYHKWNGDYHEWEKDKSLVMLDFMVVGFIQHLLVEFYKEKRQNDFFVATKYNIGDLVWTISSGGVRQLKITGIHAKSENGKSVVEYRFNNSGFKTTEDRVAKSREDLVTMVTNGVFDYDKKETKPSFISPGGLLL